MSGSETTPRLSVLVPPTLAAWERATVGVWIENTLTRPLLPLVVRLSSARGVVEAWGIQGRIIRFGHQVRGRKTAAGWEVLLGPELQKQQPGRPPPLSREATEELVQLEPLWPGESVELHTHFRAAYEHGAQLEATLHYIPLDPTERPFFVIERQPARLSWVAGRAVSQLPAGRGVGLYLPAEELRRGQQVASASTSLSIQHPAFDIEQARARAGVAEGPFGYDAQAGRWVLVDPPARRTLVVGPAGPVEALPGDWLESLLALNDAATAPIFWRAGSGAEAEGLRAELERAGIEVGPAAHKGAASPGVLLVSLTRSAVSELVRLMRARGVRLEEAQVVN